MSTYRLQYLGETLDEFESPSDDLARNRRAGFAAAIMLDMVPNFLGPDDFESLEDCIHQLRLIRVTVHDRDLELFTPSP